MNIIRKTMIQMTKTEYDQLLRDNIGICTGCGGMNDQVTKNDENLKCTLCGEPSVYSVQRLLMMGKLEFPWS
jgi:hypothetical protein